MPTFTYLCQKPSCQRKTQETKSISAMSRPLPKCPACSSKMALIIDSPPAAIIKNPAAGYRS
jgi:predicted nucleic acid-binding Zn ribbon protein